MKILKPVILSTKTMKLIYFPVIGVSMMLLFSLASCNKDNNLFSFDDKNQSGEMIINGGTMSMLTLVEQLGKSIYFDRISVPNSMACADCHAPRAGFTGPMSGFNMHGSVYRGADAQSFGNRKPPTAAYASFSPVFHFDGELFIGGNFWDGRATGERLGSPTAEQALGPFLNPAEHNVPDMQTVLMKIAESKYVSLWEQVWGEPLDYSTEAEIAKNYDRVGLAIAAYESSAEVNQFTSKFDYVLKGMASFTPQEAWGFELFNSEEKGKCALCHLSDGEKPLFTDFTYDNLGVPKNPENPVYKNDPDFIDPGLGGYLLTRDEYRSMAAGNIGKHKVPTLRNVDKRPGEGFTKAYTHNGVFKSLKDVVHFYNTRDVLNWPEPEVAENVNKEELGNLGLTDAEEKAIVAFMMTLSDGYRIK